MSYVVLVDHGLATEASRDITVHGAFDGRDEAAAFATEVRNGVRYVESFTGRVVDAFVAPLQTDAMTAKEAHR